MKINQQLLQINRNFLICFIISSLISALTAQTFFYFPSHFNTTITITIGYIAFFLIFVSIFHYDNKKRYKNMEIKIIKKEIIKLISSLGVGEIFYIVIRWFLQFYFLEINFEPYLASLSSEIITTSFYMCMVTIFLKVTKTY